jgi:hypothetical protein
MSRNREEWRGARLEKRARRRGVRRRRRVFLATYLWSVQRCPVLSSVVARGGTRRGCGTTARFIPCQAHSDCKKSGDGLRPFPWRERRPSLVCCSEENRREQGPRSMDQGPKDYGQRIDDLWMIFTAVHLYRCQHTARHLNTSTPASTANLGSLSLANAKTGFGNECA